MLVPSLGLRASQVVAAVAVVGGIAAEIDFTRRCKGKPLMVPLAMNADNRSLLRKLQKQGGALWASCWMCPQSCPPAPPGPSFWKKPMRIMLR